MKKAPALILAVITALALLYTIVFFIWRNDGSGSLHIRSVESSQTVAVSGEEGTDIENGLVDINTADLAQLMTLPGIGETLAGRIIDYRNSHGPFDSVAGLLNVEGIGAGKLESILDLITTGGTT